MSRKGHWHSSKILLLQFASITRSHEGAQWWLLLILTLTVSTALSALKCIRTEFLMSVTQKASGLQVISHSLSSNFYKSDFHTLPITSRFLSDSISWNLLTFVCPLELRVPYHQNHLHSQTHKWAFSSPLHQIRVFSEGAASHKNLLCGSCLVFLTTLF